MNSFNYIKDLYNGKIKLVIVFWIYNLLVGMLIDEFLREEILNKNFNFIFFFYFYSFFINKALWLSSTNYKGRKLWGYLVKVIVILDLIWLIGIFPYKIFVE